MIEEETRNESENASAFAIARRVYADILAAHDNNRSLPHPDSCSHGLVYSHLVKQAERVKDAGYWINDPKRNPNEVGNKKGLGTLAICYQPEVGRKPTRPLEIGFREFMNAFNEIRR